jgi:hypothetical protein
MKWLWAFILAVFFILRVEAQIFQSPEMLLNMDLTQVMESSSIPTANFKVLSPVFQKTYATRDKAGIFGFQVVAKDSQTAEVIFQGTKGNVPLYLPTQFEWIVYDSDTLVTTNTDSLLIHSFELGGSAVILQTDTPMANGEPVLISVWVFTPSQAVDELKRDLWFMPLTENQYNHFMEQLSKASRYFDKGNLYNGAFELGMFIQQIGNLHHHDQATLSTLQSSKGLLESLYWPDSEIRLVEH